jgi:hypothetical protein
MFYYFLFYLFSDQLVEFDLHILLFSYLNLTLIRVLTLLQFLTDLTFWSNLNYVNTIYSHMFLQNSI